MTNVRQAIGGSIVVELSTADPEIVGSKRRGGGEEGRRGGGERRRGEFSNKLYLFKATCSITLSQLFINCGRKM